jgi:hypothetical protein
LILKSKLGPVDSADCRELLIELGTYDTSIRIAELKDQFGSLSEYKEYEFKAIHGDIVNTAGDTSNFLGEL